MATFHYRGANQVRGGRASRLIVFIALAMLSSAAYAKRSGGGGHSYSGSPHTSSHGGSYSLGQGSSHKGGHYRNAATGNHYGKHK
jgi:hypothetical protein